MRLPLYESQEAKANAKMKGDNRDDDDDDFNDDDDDDLAQNSGSFSNL